jgi:hypothetical protein
MERRAKRGVGVVGAVVALVALLVGGCDDPPAPTPAAPRSPESNLATALVRTRARARPQDPSTVAATTTFVHAKPNDLLASPLAAPALGLVLPGGTEVDVDPRRGDLTLRETDASLPFGLGLRRARWAACKTPGLFGRGWRSEADARIYALDHGLLAIRRVEGVVVFAPVRPGLWTTLVGEVEWLTATGDGFEVEDPAGRIHRFDRAGRITEVMPGFKVERTPTEVRLVGAVATLTLGLDDQGRAISARGPGVDLVYDYDAQGELVAVRGTRFVRYQAHDPDGDWTITGVDGGRGPGLRIQFDDELRPTTIAAPALAPGWVQAYHFDRGLAEVTTPRGTFRYRRRTTAGGSTRPRARAR